MTGEGASPLPGPRSAVHWIAFGAGAGLSPRAPGTAGTLVAVPIYLAIGAQPPAVHALVVALVISIGVWVCGRTARDLGVHDHPGIVAFRILDIAKPWPVSLADRKVGGGLGIMLDDVIAGALACATLHAVRFAMGG